jgi:4'-phosphopantetheinyl transferase EntD
MIVPPEVECEEAFGEATDGVLFAEEETTIAHAVESRRREYATVRNCARECLGRLGYPRAPIVRGAGGAPEWPTGVRGSMTHCSGYAAAAVGLADRISALGIDAEPDEPLPEGVLAVVTTPTERSTLAETPRMPGGPSLDRLVFSAKEAVYKAWFPLVGVWLDPQEAEILIAPDTGTFTAVLSRDDLIVDGHTVTRLEGRWVRERGILVTAVALTRE